MPPQQSRGLLDVFGKGEDFGAHVFLGCAVGRRSEEREWRIDSWRDLRSGKSDRQQIGGTPARLNPISPFANCLPPQYNPPVPVVTARSASGETVMAPDEDAPMTE